MYSYDIPEVRNKKGRWGIAQGPRRLHSQEHSCRPIHCISQNFCNLVRYHVLVRKNKSLQRPTQTDKSFKSRLKTHLF